MILDRLKRLAAKHEGIEVVWLYGSRATGQELPDSDFDLAIAFCDVAKDALQRQTRCDHLKFEWADKLELAEMLSIISNNRKKLIFQITCLSLDLNINLKIYITTGYLNS